jgi:ankyrin repeat protein
MVFLFYFAKNGHTALYGAVMSGRLDMVTLLIDNGCDVNNTDNVCYIFSNVLLANSTYVFTLC